VTVTFTVPSGRFPSVAVATAIAAQRTPAADSADDAVDCAVTVAVATVR
jgi:hypothetical protein